MEILYKSDNFSVTCANNIICIFSKKYNNSMELLSNTKDGFIITELLIDVNSNLKIEPKENPNMEINLLKRDRDKQLDNVIELDYKCQMLENENEHLRFMIDYLMAAIVKFGGGE